MSWFQSREGLPILSWTFETHAIILLPVRGPERTDAASAKPQTITGPTQAKPIWTLSSQVARPI